MMWYGFEDTYTGKNAITYTTDDGIYLVYIPATTHTWVVEGQLSVEL